MRKKRFSNKLYTIMKISTESYKGVRDFYPEDLFIQKHIFSIWRSVVESFGYVEYNASVLEDANLYKAKSGEEIVNEQTYTFTDRGDREVTLRPEMTPTVARMVAAKSKELVFPLRWYSIPNLFRYEKPQRGRLREHWQLNVDLFGVESTDADVEIISIAYKIMRGFGATDNDFQIKINSRKILNDIYTHFNISEEKSYTLSKIIDKKDKISEDIFRDSVRETIGDTTDDFIRVLTNNERLIATLGSENANTKELIALIEKLNTLGITNIVFDTTLMRGFDYYTGIVFEVFDTNPDNRRSIFGGGRYNDLLDIFGADKVPAIGFGAGDVTAQDFLETHDLLPKYSPTAQIYICVLNNSLRDHAGKLADTLRTHGLKVVIDLSSKKVGDQMKIAHKQSIPFVIVVGEDEVTTGIYPVKNMESGEEVKAKAEEITNIILK